MLQRSEVYCENLKEKLWGGGGRFGGGVRVWGGGSGWM